MPLYRRHFEPGQLQFITSSTCRRASLFSHPAYRSLLVEALRAARSKFVFRLAGWVLMPEHFHLLLQPSLAKSTSAIVKDFKQRSAFKILAALRAERDFATRALLQSFRLPATVHDRAHYRVCQRRFFPFNIYTEKKHLEKLATCTTTP